ncbi:MAG: hydroxymethylbilane synthase [Anaerolineae bacterium]|nr:hydroxymethylbilane synthase [Anaerolineae bacterium]
MPELKLATRPSKLARWQTNFVINSLEDNWPDLKCKEYVTITKGDRVVDKPLPEIGGKGLFTQELEQGLLANDIDAVVHSLKDLPTEDSPGLVLGAILERAPAGDVLISPKSYTLDTLPQGAAVGTSSLRRKAQLLAHRPDLRIKPVRGNIDTRIHKVQEGQYDAIVLAAAGVSRLELDNLISQNIPMEIMLPAPGQGALAIQCRGNDVQTIEYLSPLDHKSTRLAVLAERQFLAVLEGGCSLPVGAYASIKNNLIKMRAVVLDLAGEQIIQVDGEGNDATELGNKLAQDALAQGAREVLHA